MNLQRIINQYDPENDLIPGGPRVTWAEMELAEAVVKLLERVTKLEAEQKPVAKTEAEIREQIKELKDVITALNKSDNPKEDIAALTARHQASINALRWVLGELRY